MNKWYNIELNYKEWAYLKSFLLTRGIYFETSGVNKDLVHIEIKTTEIMADIINKYMDSL